MENIKKKNNIENDFNKKEKPFGLQDKLGYFMGELGNSFVFMFVSMYLMIFYTKVWGVSASLVGLLFLVARFIDAFSDITMGTIIDKSNPTKDGKFKVWIKRMSGPLALMTFLMFQSGLATASMTVKIIVMFITYILWGSVCYTSVNIPYGSMTSAITENPAERASLSTWRSLGSSLTGIIIGSIAPQIIYYADANGNQLINPQNFTATAGVFSLVSLVCYMGCYKLTTERVKFTKNESQEKVFILKSFKALLKNKALISLLIISMILLLSMLLVQTMNQYLFADYFKNINALSMLNLVGLPVTLAIASVVTKLSAKYGKKELSSIGMFFAGVIYLFMYLLKIDNAMIYVALYTIAMLGTSALNMLIWAIITDVIDYNEILSGERNDGAIYGIYSFSRKIGQALAGGFGGFALSLIGYNSLEIVQNTSVINGIYAISTLFPAICCILIALILLFVYPLSKKVVEENSQKLTQMRNK